MIVPTEDGLPRRADLLIIAMGFAFMLVVTVIFIQESQLQRQSLLGVVSRCPGSLTVIELIYLNCLA